MKQVQTKNRSAIMLLAVLAVVITTTIGLISYSQHNAKKDIRLPNQNQPAVSSQVLPSGSIGEGKLSGQVFCGQTVRQDPCYSSFKISSTTTQTIQTDASGKFEVKLATGRYNVTPDPKDGYPVIAPINNPVIINADQTTSLNIIYKDGSR